MRKLFEEDGVYNEAHANELLRVQTLYNQKLQALNNELAKQKAQLAIKYMNATKTQQAVTAQQATLNQPKPTGNVNPAGQPTDAQGNVKTVESYSDILNVSATPVNELVKEVIRKPAYPGDRSNWYNRAQTRDERIARESRPVVRREPRAPGYGSEAYWKRKKIKETLEGEIEDIKQNIEYYEEKFSTPTFRGVEGEIEQFFADAGFEASDILNQGVPRKEKLQALKELGVDDAEDLVDNYYYYYPQYDDTTAKERKAAEKEVAKLEIQLAAKEKRLEKYMYESLDQKKTLAVNESVYDATKIDPAEYQELKNYLDSENVSYIEDEAAGTIEFDDTDIDDEWAQRLPEKFEDETPDILSVKDDDSTDDPAKVAAMDDKIDEDKVFYVKIEDEGGVFYGKVYKLFDDGDWRAKLVKGESDTFEKLNYDPDWDEFDVIAFLRENYADAELIDESEFNKIVESADDRDPMFPFPGDKYEIIGDALSPRHRTMNLDIEPTTTNTSGTGHYEFKIGDILTYDDSNDYDSSFWITPDGRRGRIWSLPRSLVANHILRKVKYQRIHESLGNKEEMFKEACEQLSLKGESWFTTENAHGDEVRVLGIDEEGDLQGFYFSDGVQWRYCAWNKKGFNRTGQAPMVDLDRGGAEDAWDLFFGHTMGKVFGTGLSHSIPTLDEFDE